MDREKRCLRTRYCTDIGTYLTFEAIQIVLRTIAGELCAASFGARQCPNCPLLPPTQSPGLQVTWLDPPPKSPHTKLPILSSSAPSFHSFPSETLFQPTVASTGNGRLFR